MVHSTVDQRSLAKLAHCYSFIQFSVFSLYTSIVLQAHSQLSMLHTEKSVGPYIYIRWWVEVEELGMGL